MRKLNYLYSKKDIAKTRRQSEPEKRRQTNGAVLDMQNKLLKKQISKLMPEADFAFYNWGANDEHSSVRIGKYINDLQNLFSLYPAKEIMDIVGEELGLKNDV